MAKLKLDLHDIYNKGALIDKTLSDAIDECCDSKISTLEIIPGKGSGQLKKKVLRFLDQKSVKQKYHRIDKDSKNHGRLFVYFRFK
ncbi:MAG TPA: DNA mismatch repair protein MutS [Flavobacteriales bacterium]|jgi:DNA-nicking Smr family endonuclease|nr:DNA mismatch repair protein MutS [Flavobacteriales bacterium]